MRQSIAFTYRLSYNVSIREKHNRQENLMTKITFNFIKTEYRDASTSKEISSKEISLIKIDLTALKTKIERLIAKARRIIANK